MSTSESFSALRRANPRTKPGFSDSVEAAAGAVRAEIGLSAPRVPEGATGRPQRRRLVRVSAAGATLAVAAAAAAALTISSLGGSPGVEDAAAAVKKVALVTAASAERSGTARVRIMHGGALWAGKTVRWHGASISISGEPVGPSRRVGDELLVVDGLVYGPDPEVEGGWLEMAARPTPTPTAGRLPASTSPR